MHPVAGFSGRRARIIQRIAQSITLRHQFFAAFAEVLDRCQGLMQTAAGALHVRRTPFDLLLQIQCVRRQALEAMPDLLCARLLATHQRAYLGEHALRGLDVTLLHLAGLFCLGQGQSVVGQPVGQLLHLRLQVGLTLQQFPDLLLACQDAGTCICPALHTHPAAPDPQAIRGNQALARAEFAAPPQCFDQIAGSVDTVQDMDHRRRTIHQCRQRSAARLRRRSVAFEKRERTALERGQAATRSLELLDHAGLQLLGQHDLDRPLPGIGHLQDLEQARCGRQSLRVQPLCDALVALNTRGLLQRLQRGEAPFEGLELGAR